MLDLFNMEAIDHSLRYYGSFTFEGYLFSFIDQDFFLCAQLEFYLIPICLCGVQFWGSLEFMVYLIIPHS